MSARDSTAGEMVATHRSTRIDLRRAWVQIHLWLGLTLGTVGAFVGITGSILVYDTAIDAWLNPQRYQTTGAAAALAYSEYAQRAAQAVGDGARALNMRIPEEAGLPLVVFVRARGETGGFRRVYLDPPTGRVLDAPSSSGLIGWAHDFHESLKLREYSGREIVGVVGIGMLISSLSGIYLWWPLRRFSASAFGFRRGFVLSRNLHYTFGFYASLILAMLCFTGIFLAFPEAGRNAVGVFGPLSLSPRGIQAVGEPGAKPIGPDAAVAIARGMYPGAKVIGIGLPAGPRGAYRIALREAGDESARPATQVFIDPVSQAILRKIDRATQTRGDVFIAYQRPLHEGDTFGALGRVLIFITGCLPALFVVTGAMMWLRTRRARKAAARQPLR